MLEVPVRGAAGRRPLRCRLASTERPAATTVPAPSGRVRAAGFGRWLHQRGDVSSALGRELKADIKERFFPSGDKWREMVWARADQTIGWALKGLGAP